MIVQPASPSLAEAPRRGPLRFTRVGLVGKYQALGSRDALESVAEFLLNLGCEVMLEQETATNTGLTQHESLPLKRLGQTCDLVLVIGGDGTLLGAARQLARHAVPMIGINQGRLGFITDVRFDEFAQTLEPMLRGAYEEDPRSLIHAEVWRDGDRIFDTLAVNDVVVNRTSAGMVELRIEVGGRLVARQRADGLIISTPTGSTAYALSAGGPLLHPSIAGWVMVPIAPHTLSNRPIVLPSDEDIEVEVVGGREVSANFDMQTITSLLHGDRIRVRASNHRLTLLHPVGWSHFDTLRNKLHWNENAVGAGG